MQHSRSFSRKALWLAAAVIGVFALTGCSSDMYPVTGKLVYEDNKQPVKELAGFDITFTSDKIGKSARGTIKSDGTFSLYSIKENDGVFPGEYVVTLTQPEKQAERPDQGPPVVDRKYQDPATSDLKAEVKQQSNNFTFALKRYSGK